MSTAARLSAPERRRQILAAACEAFAAHGYHGTGTADIARACGCSEPVIYKHFPGKRALFVAVLDEAHAKAGDHLAAIGASEDPLGELLAMSRRLYGDDAFCRLVQVRMNALQLVDEPEVGEALRRSLSRFHDKIAACVRRAQELGRRGTASTPSRWPGCGSRSRSAAASGSRCGGRRACAGCRTPPPS